MIAYGYTVKKGIKMKSTYYFDNSTATLVRHRVSIWVMTSEEPK